MVTSASDAARQKRPSPDLSRIASAAQSMSVVAENSRSNRCPIKGVQRRNGRTRKMPRDLIDTEPTNASFAATTRRSSKSQMT
jgi:hypothetical protein